MSRTLKDMSGRMDKRRRQTVLDRQRARQYAKRTAWSPGGKRVG